MTFLEMVQNFARIANLTPDTGTPGSIVGLSGQMQQAVDYINRANDDIQNHYFDWKFLWATDSFPTVAATADYAGKADLGIWDATNIYYSGERLTVIEWEDYTADSSLANNEPEFCVIRPDNRLLLVPTPDDVYTVSYDYFKKPVALDTADDGDVSVIPAQFHWAIVGMALMEWGMFESAPEARAQGEELFNRFYTRLVEHQQPRLQQREWRDRGRVIPPRPVAQEQK